MIQFVFNDRVYFAENKSKAKEFIKFWDSPFSRVFRIKSTYKIIGVERSPSWVPQPLILDQIEYARL